MRIATKWFQSQASQGVFGKAATLPPVMRSGPVSSMGKNAKVVPPQSRYFVVGESVVGDDKIVGGEKT